MDTNEQGKPLDATVAARMLYEARLEVMKTAVAFVSAGIEPERIAHAVDLIEARLLAPDLDRTWVIHYAEEGHWYFAGFAAGLPVYTSSPKAAIRFARRQDAQEVLETMPLQDEEQRVRFDTMIATGDYT